MQKLNILSNCESMITKATKTDIDDAHKALYRMLPHCTYGRGLHNHGNFNQAMHCQNGNVCWMRRQRET
jgi:hypothetical protein